MDSPFFSNFPENFQQFSITIRNKYQILQDMQETEDPVEVEEGVEGNKRRNASSKETTKLSMDVSSYYL